MYDTKGACTRTCLYMRDANLYEQAARKCELRMQAGLREHAMRSNSWAFIHSGALLMAHERLVQSMQSPSYSILNII